MELLQVQEVAGSHQHVNYHCVTTGDGSEYNVRALLIATGGRYERVDLPGETDYLAAGVKGIDFKMSYLPYHMNAIPCRFSTKLGAHCPI